MTPRLYWLQTPGAGAADPLPRTAATAPGDNALSRLDPCPLCAARPAGRVASPPAGAEAAGRCRAGGGAQRREEHPAAGAHGRHSPGECRRWGRQAGQAGHARISGCGGAAGCGSVCAAALAGQTRGCACVRRMPPSTSTPGPPPTPAVGPRMAGPGLHLPPAHPTCLGAGRGLCIHNTGPPAWGGAASNSE